jgi:hypothetical protein
MDRRAYLTMTLALLSVLGCKQSEDSDTSPPLTVKACKERCDQKQTECSEACPTALCRGDCDNASKVCIADCQHSDAGARDAAADGSSQADDPDAGAVPRIDASVQAEQTQRIAESDAGAVTNLPRTQQTSLAGGGAAGTSGAAGNAAGSGAAGAAGTAGNAAGSGGLGAAGVSGSFAPVGGTGGFGPAAGVGPEAGIGGPIPRVPVGGFGPTGGELMP